MTHEQIVKEAKERYPLPERDHTSESNPLDRVIIILQQKAWIAARTLSMQEREKELSDCWDACHKHIEEIQEYPYGRHGGYKVPDKQQYINKITGKK